MITEVRKRIYDDEILSYISENKMLDLKDLKYIGKDTYEFSLIHGLDDNAYNIVSTALRRTKKALYPEEHKNYRDEYKLLKADSAIKKAREYNDTIKELAIKFNKSQYSIKKLNMSYTLTELKNAYKKDGKWCIPELTINL